MGLNKQISMEQLNIYQKLLKITSEIGIIEKDLNIKTGKSSGYKAVGERNVLDAVKPLEVKYGVYSYACNRKVIDSGELISTKKDYETGEVKESRQMYLRIEVTYRFVNVDNPAECIEITSYGDGIDSGDKATGKAMTYADKYALLKAYKISTGDDPDQEASGDLKAFKNNSGKATDKQLAMLKQYYKDDALKKLLEKNNVNHIEDIPYEKAFELVGKIMELKKEKNNG